MSVRRLQCIKGVTSHWIYGQILCHMLWLLASPSSRASEDAIAAILPKQLPPDMTVERTPTGQRILHRLWLKDSSSQRALT
jgi:hypothetical protein